MSFKRQLSVAVEEINQTVTKQYRLALNETFIAAVNQTPVDKGQAINSWFVDLGGVNRGEKREQLDASGSDSIREIQAKGRNVQLGGQVLLYSNLPYMERLENGWSLKSDSMVKDAVANWPNVWRKYSGG